MDTRYRFVVDVNVGRLARWLRVMGYDTLFFRKGDDNDLIRIALKQDRVLVTRDSGFAPRWVVKQGIMKVVQIRDDQLDGQLKQLIQDLELDSDREFSLCVECNQPLIPVDREQLEARVPPFVFQHQQNFMECPVCERVYWHGTHWARMTERLKRARQEAER